MHVYKITNKINGKIYIGKTIKDDIQKRLKEHYNFSSNKGKKMMISEAIKKYGLENFEIQSIYKGVDDEDICKAEIKFIKLFKSTDKSIGYNILSGGNGVVPTEELRKKLSERAKLRIGELNPFFGKNHTQEQKHKWQKNRSGVSTRKTPISQEEKNRASKRLKELRKDPEFINKMLNNRLYKKGIGASRNRAVICLNTGEVFESAKICADDLNNRGNSKKFNRKSIGEVCRGVKKTHNNLIFKFEDGLVNKNKISNTKSKIKIYVEELNLTFNSKKECAIYLEEKTGEKYWEKYMKNNTVYKNYKFQYK